jgi:hypothetical protein
MRFIALAAIIYFLTFVGPCIVIYFYGKTNQMHNISNLFYFGATLYMFRMVFPSIIRSLRLYIQHQVYVIQVLWLLASRNEMEFHLVPASKQAVVPVWHIPDTVCTVLDSWWWTERPPKTCRVLLQNKINLRCYASGWFYYRNHQMPFIFYIKGKGKVHPCTGTEALCRLYGL